MINQSVGTKKSKHIMQDFGGFTLIELLVVVLIIGILTAVALPQYQVAVEKSRMTEAVGMLRSIAQANRVHMMATGRYATDLDELGVEVPGQSVTVDGLPRKETTDFQFGARKGSFSGSIAVAKRLPVDSLYELVVWADGTICCYSYDEQGLSLCRQVSQDVTNDTYTAAGSFCYTVTL